MSGRNVTVVGLQWGDEGKGKIVDALAGHMRYVVRYCGGANAGHTVLVGQEKFALHLIPCGVLRQDVCNIVGNGVAFDPVVAWKEISALRQRNVSVDGENLRISSAANVVMPWHKLQDTLSEASLAEGKKIGTTARGIGPCYSDKANRSTAIRAADLLDASILGEKIRAIVEIKNKIFAALYDAEAMDAEAIVSEYTELGKNLEAMICNTGGLLRAAVAGDVPILFEGGQGSMLDVDHGTYPFVTSSNVTACGVPSGAGIPPSAIGRVVGLIKAYSTRVGEGPFPTEQDNELGDTIRQAGNEYGTTTGRPRRCGWFDAFAVKYATDLSGVDEFALSLLDVLTGLSELNICTGYRIKGQVQEMFDPAKMSGVECIYKTLPGWDSDITGCRTFDQLPAEARDYVNCVEELLQRPVGFVSVGPERSQTIMHNSLTEGLDK